MFEIDFKNRTLLCEPMSPIEFFKPKDGVITRCKDGYYEITINLEPFYWSGEEVNTSIRLGSIDFGGIEFNQLSRKRFSFLPNPNEGYVDGSVYLEGHHNYLDVSLIYFGLRYNEIAELQDETEDFVTATILYRFCWEGDSPEDYPETKRINIVLLHKPIL